MVAGLPRAIARDRAHDALKPALASFAVASDGELKRIIAGSSSHVVGAHLVTGRGSPANRSFPPVIGANASFRNGTAAEKVSVSGGELLDDHYLSLIVFLLVMVIFLTVIVAWFLLHLRDRSREREFRRQASQDSGEREFRRQASQDTTATSASPWAGSASPPASEALSSLGVDEEPESGVRSLLCMRINVLLLFVPIGWLSHWLHWGNKPTFILNLLAILPLAAVTGEATEELALHVGPLASGLVVATFGNAIELIMAFEALQRGLVEQTKGTLLGSILSSELLILGGAMLYGGLIDRGGDAVHAAQSKQQEFTKASARTQAQVALFAAFCLAMPSFFSASQHTTREHELVLARGGSAVVLAGYFVVLVFQLGTHRDLMRGQPADDAETLSPRVTAMEAGGLLLCCIVLMAVSSEWAVKAMEGFAAETGISSTFLSTMVMPVVGNACEHATAITVGMRDNLDLAISIALGSAVQIALFALPLTVVVGWAIDQPMNISFGHTSTEAMVLSALLVSGSLASARSNWLQGFMLVAAYLLLAILFFFMPENSV